MSEATKRNLYGAHVLIQTLNPAEPMCWMELMGVDQGHFSSFDAAVGSAREKLLAALAELDAIEAEEPGHE